MVGVSQLGIICLHLLVIDHGCCLEMIWTQYSDRASLPLALHARQELRSSLDRLPIQGLSAADKMKVVKLKRLLDEVIAESLRELEADAKRPGMYRLKRDLLRPDRLGLLALLLLLGWGFLRVSKSFQVSAATTAASKEADSIMETERSQLEGKKVVLQAVKCGEVFPGEVAEALCHRISSSLTGQTNKKVAKATKSDKPGMNSRELTLQLAQFYELSEVELVEKALRKEKKKLTITAQALDKAIEDAKEAEKKAVALVALRREPQKIAEDAAKKAPKNVKKAQDAEHARKFADDAQKAAGARAADVEKARQAAGEAWAKEARPELVHRMEGAWLGALVQAWGQHATKLGGTPTPSHMHAWARDKTLRQRTEKLYAEAVCLKSFFE